MTWWLVAERGLAALSELLRWLARWLTVCLCVLAAAAFVLWDVDLNAVRARYERAMLALFGTWDAGVGAAVADGGTVFETRTVDGLSFVTGWSRTEMPHHRWCYVARTGAGEAARVLTLGRSPATGVVRWLTISDREAAVFDMTADRLMAAARRGCVLERMEADHAHP